MKPCPYCAEEIQDAAIKCRFCGEWLEKKIENASGAVDSIPSELTEEYTESANVDRSSISEQASFASPQFEKDAGESSAASVYSPLARKPKWGWGWLLLLAMIAPMGKLDYYITETNSFIMIFSFFFLPAFYFWYRRRLIEKNQNVIKIWHFSFRAGFVTYIIALAFVFLVSYLGAIQERKDNQTFLSQFQGKMAQIKKEESKISDNFIASPDKDEDIDTNISILEDYLRLISKKKKIYNEFASYMEEYGTRKNDSQIINDVKFLNSESSTLFQISEDSITSLLNYYKTGDEKWHNKYENLISKMEDAEKKYKLSAENLMKKVKY